VRTWLVLLAGCVGGPTTDPGLSAEVRVANAQFYGGAMPAATNDLAVTSIDSLNNTIWSGQVGKSLSGRMAGTASAVALGFPGDSGYWIIPAGAADINLPDELTWSAKLSFSDALPVGMHELDVAAVDARGDFGPPATLDLTVRDRQLDPTTVNLAFSLRWDTEADLDIHVALPGDPPAVIWTGNPSSYVTPPPGDPIDPGALAAAGFLDADSNAQCVIDGRREENVMWRGATAIPPRGHYAVLVDAFSLCGAPTAHWTVDVFAGGGATSLAHAEGTITDADLRGDHAAESGTLALTFDE
jgi:hypothetical protein